MNESFITASQQGHTTRQDSIPNLYKPLDLGIKDQGQASDEHLQRKTRFTTELEEGQNIASSSYKNLDIICNPTEEKSSPFLVQADGVDIWFPYEPYEPQKIYMQKGKKFIVSSKYSGINHRSFK